MRILPGKQGTPEWLQNRLGVVTASNLDQILTPGGKLSASSSKYLARLVAEWFTGAPVDVEKSQFMDRGTDLEPEAVFAWEWEANMNATEVGFCVRDDGRVGCSPDRLVGEDGGLEVKCPSMVRHLEYHFNPTLLEADYRMQVQGCLWITGRAWWEIISWNPILPMVRQRIEPNAELHAAMDAAVSSFLMKLDAARSQFARLKALQETMRAEREDGAHPF